MREERFVISDRSWAAIEPLVPGTVRDRGVTAKNTRLFLEAVLWRVRVGGPWRDLPPGVWRVEQYLPSVSPLGATGRIPTHFRGGIGRSRF